MVVLVMRQFVRRFSLVFRQRVIRSDSLSKDKAPHVCWMLSVLVFLGGGWPRVDSVWIGAACGDRLDENNTCVLGHQLRDLKQELAQVTRRLMGILVILY